MNPLGLWGHPVFRALLTNPPGTLARIFWHILMQQSNTTEGGFSINSSNFVNQPLCD
jgi:hypothetical protein